MSRTAKEFLKTGKTSSSDFEGLAEECRKLIHKEVQRSATAGYKMAQQFIKHAQPQGDIFLQAAYRALGWANHARSKYHLAEKAYLKARELSLRKPHDRAKIDLILIDIYMYLGNFKEAKRRAGLALKTFRKLGDKLQETRTQVNYANLLHRQDRHREAAKLYHQSSKILQSIGDPISVGVCCYNEANVLVQLFDFSKAQALYAKAEKIFEKNEYSLFANECRYAIAWLKMLQGDYHHAIYGLSESKKRYLDADHPRGVLLCKLDLAEAYLGLNLWTDSRNASISAEKLATKLGMHYEKAKAAYFRAKVAFAIGESLECKAALIRAEKNFKIEKNQPFLAAVKLFNAQSKTDNDESLIEISKAKKIFSKFQLPLWNAICDLQLLLLDPKNIKVSDSLKNNPAVKVVPHLFAQWQTLLGDQYASDGQKKLAEKHWERAVAMLDKVRAKLPPVDLRSAFLKHRLDPYMRMINAKLEDNSNEAAVWSEKLKTAGLWVPVNFKSDSLSNRKEVAKSLEKLAQHVTAISLQISERSKKRSSPTTQSQRALEKLQDSVRFNLIAIESNKKVLSQNLNELLQQFQNESKHQVIVQFQYDQDDLIAFIHHKGLTRFHRYFNGRQKIKEFLGWWQILLSKHIRQKSKSKNMDVAEENLLFAQLAEWLWLPLEISRNDKNILILPESGLSNMPWQALLLGNQRLVEIFDIVVSPSLRHHIHANQISVKSSKVELFIGNIKGLKYTNDEIIAVTSSTKRAVAVHNPCARADWPSDSKAWIWHFTGHAHSRSDNPFYSSLEMSDGPMFAADFRLKQNRVALVVLAACRTGQQTFVPGEESAGLVRSFIEMGTKNVIASNWSIDDRSTSIWMREFYKIYFDGHSIHESVRRAVLKVKEKYPSAYNWAPFLINGSR